MQFIRNSNDSNCKFSRFFSSNQKLVYDEKVISKHELLVSLQDDFKGHEIIQTMLLNKVPKYGNDIKWVDELEQMGWLF